MYMYIHIFVILKWKFSEIFKNERRQDHGNSTEYLRENQINLNYVKAAIYFAVTSDHFYGKSIPFNRIQTAIFVKLVKICRLSG